MATIVIPTFAGEMPRTTPRLLDRTQASIAINCKLERGSLKPLKGPKLETELPESSQTIFKHNNCGWLSWENICNVCKSAVLDYSKEEPLGQLFITGDKEYPTQYLACDKWYRLGLPRPEKAPVVEIVEGANPGDDEEEEEKDEEKEETETPDDTEDKEVEDGEDGEDGEEDEEPKDNPLDIGIERTSTYCYTYVRSLADGRIQQESAPSPASEIIDVKHGDGVLVSGFELPDDPNGDMAITHIRIYRVMTGNVTAEFHFLVELEVPVESYLDIVHDADLSSDLLETTDWDMIPDDAKGLILTDNGIYAAFRANELLISEPNVPYAFPESYRLTVEDDIVALAHVDGSIIVLTEGRPYLVTGAEPASFAVTHLTFEQSCVSARSVASGTGCVMYASPDGLMYFSSSNQELFTAKTFTREQWQALGPDKLMGKIHEQRYLGFWAGTNHGFILDMSARDIVRVEFPCDWKVLAMYHHSLDDCIYLSIDKKGAPVHAVFQFESDKPMPYTWRSKPFFTSTLTSMSAVRVEADYRHRMPVEVFVYGSDDKLHPRQHIHVHDRKAKRIRPTRSEKIWAVEIHGTTEAFEVRLGGSVVEVEHGASS